MSLEVKAFTWTKETNKVTGGFPEVSDFGFALPTSGFFSLHLNPETTKRNSSTILTKKQHCNGGNKPLKPICFCLVCIFCGSDTFLVIKITLFSPSTLICYHF